MPLTDGPRRNVIVGEIRNDRLPRRNDILRKQPGGKQRQECKEEDRLEASRQHWRGVLPQHKGAKAQRHKKFGVGPIELIKQESDPEFFYSELTRSGESSMRRR